MFGLLISGNNPNVVVSKIEVSFPIRIPGKMTFSFKMHVNRPIENVTYMLNVSRYAYFMDMPVPCVELDDVNGTWWLVCD